MCAIETTDGLIEEKKDIFKIQEKIEGGFQKRIERVIPILWAEEQEETQRHHFWPLKRKWLLF